MPTIPIAEASERVADDTTFGYPVHRADVKADGTNRRGSG